MYCYLLRKNPAVILYLILAPLSALCSVAAAAAMAAAVDYASGGALSEIWRYLLFFAVYILLDFVIDTAARLAKIRLVKQTMVALQSDVYHKISRMCYLHFFQRNTADYIANLTTDTDVLRNSYFGILLSLYSDGIRFLAAAAVLFWMSPLLGCFVLVNSLLQTAIPMLYAGKLKNAGAHYSNAQESHMLVLKENLSAFLTAKTFHIEDKLEQNYRRALEHAEERRGKMNALKNISSNLSFIFSRVSYLGVFLLGAVLTIKGLISTAQVVAASQLIVYISSPIYTLNVDLADLRTAKASAKKLQVFLDEQEDRGGSQRLERPDGHIQVQDLHFGYGQREILSGFTYDFRPGRKYLIIGASGSGKSTLLTLLAGLRSDYDGSITLGGHALRQLSRESLSACLCSISQEPFLFDDTLYNNVCLYEKMDEDTVIQALHRAGLQAFLAALPLGIHTPVGENASAMSGGEKQRLVIARALVRRTPILLLDESTSHLDPATAAEIEQLVLGLEGVTVLLVSHNATETARALSDEVLEIRDGVPHPVSGGK